MGKVILHVLAMSTYSGAENVVCQIIKMFADDEDIKMIYCSPEGPIREVLKEKNIEFEPMKALSVQELKRVIQRTRPNIIHAHDVRASLIAATCCGDVMLISHIHNNWEKLRKVSLKGLLYLYAARKANAIIWVSDSAFKQYRYSKYFCRKSIILKNIINVDAIRNSADKNPSNKKFDIIYVGRLTYQKNPERLIEVIEKAVNRHHSLSVGIIGNGELSGVIQALIKDKNLESNVELLGYLDKPLDIVRNSKVFLMVSRWEGTPMCILEALALGVPVVGTPVDGMIDLVQKGENGYLSEDNDILAGYVLEVATNPDLRKQLSKTAMEKSNKYNSIVEYKRVLERVYEGQISG